MRAIVMKSFGGPEVLELAEIPDPTPKGTSVVVDVTRAGVNFADVHARQNSYLQDLELPYTPGNEVVGTVGDGSSRRRVVALPSGGGYAEKALVRKGLMWEIPDDISDDTAAALALQGNSAWHILLTSGGLQEGQTVVIPAASGGVGTIAVQLARQIGAKVIALASTEERRAAALDLGAHVALDSSSTEGLAQRVREAAGGDVHLALEMTGGPMFDALLDTLGHRGRMVVYGYAGGQIPQVSVAPLLARSITVSGFWLRSLFTDRQALPMSMQQLFGSVRSGHLKPVIGATYGLADAAQAHRDIESRTTTGKLLIDTTR
ncbi:quinone oxidoreductase family protein [Kitasatospora sp. LaBMicrA B282]|uniref:quinone oxidoreductase family protein n=1 Tax=Kitasatospora sp. LaBMicrA B282 TaxID=3420949 RepID=UPI003D108F41